MATIDDLLAALDERNLAQVVGVPHDNARARYPLRDIRVRSFDEYEDALGNYYNYHYSTCVSQGGTLSRPEAISRAKGIIEHEYRRRNGDIVSAYNDAEAGTNGGMRLQLDQICDALKRESTDHLVRQVFDTFVRPNSWPQKVSVTRQLISRFGPTLGSSFQADAPERYAGDLQALIMAVSHALQQTSSVFRRL